MIQRGARGQAWKAPRMLPMTKETIVVTRDQTDRPGQSLQDHIADPSGIVGDRIAKIEPAHIGEIDQVLLPERFIDAELRLVLLHHVLHAGVQIAAEGGHLHHLLSDRILAADSRQEKIQGRGEPDDQEKNPDPPHEIKSSQLTPRRASRTGGPSSRWRYADCVASSLCSTSAKVEWKNAGLTYGSSLVGYPFQ